ncbi:MAG: type III pantothenate kinase [Bacteroidota bacterium]
MSDHKTYLIVDAGNTKVKLVFFENDKIQKQLGIDANNLKELQRVLNYARFDQSILASVQSDKATSKLRSMIKPSVVLSHQTQIPVDLSAYKTVKTLGADRIANAVAAQQMSTSDHALVIDIGTCVKYDCVSKNKYLGGGISPGLDMRFRALHEFTGQLPYLTFESTPPFIGKSTDEAIQSGVVNGMIEELNGIVRRYEQQFQSLTIFLTGGDAKRFDKALKNSIFADENLTVKGLYLILKHNG